MVNDQLDFGVVNPGQPSAIVNPITGGSEAAAFKISGSPSMEMQLTYPASVSLVAQEASADDLSMEPLLSGNSIDSQVNSTNLVGPPALAELNGDGEYFVWVGGEIDDLSELESGVYEGDFTITVEYDF